MSKKQEQIVIQDDDDEDVKPEELIDTAENKPKTTQEQEHEADYRELEYKNVGKLTDDEKNYLINLYKNGGEHDLYNVHFYRNGTSKITRKKQPPKYNTTKRLLEQEQLKHLRAKNEASTAPTGMMTTEQILMEHVIDLETKYATLYQKHKKLKKRTKEMQEDLYFDENDTHQPIQQPIQQPQQEEVQEVEQQPEPQPEQQYSQPVYNIDQNSYINRIRRPQKGYRRMMAGVLN